MFRFLFMVCLYVVFSIVSAKGTTELCSLALHDNIVNLGDGNCTCPSGYEYCQNRGDCGKPPDILDSTLAVTERNKWWCEPCEAGFFKPANGLSACMPCESDYTWSVVGQTVCSNCSETSMLTPETKHRRCIPCPSDIVTLLKYIDLKHVQNMPVQTLNGKTQFLSRTSVVQFTELFFIDRITCRLSPMVFDVRSLLRPRTICPIGTYIDSADSSTQIQFQDLDTVCLDCVMGKYNDEIGATQCKSVTKCLDARYYDKTEISYDTTRRTIDSNCELDWYQEWVFDGTYPYVSNGETFKFDDHRHTRIMGYSACIDGNFEKCYESNVYRCRFDYLSSWKLGSIVLNDQQSLTCEYRCVDGYYLLDSKCTACAVGKYKSTDTLEWQTCENCAAGKYTPTTGSVTCVNCDIGKFSSLDRSMCMDECEPNIQYNTMHWCYPLQRSYIIELPADLRTLRINVQACLVSSDLPDSQLSPWGTNVPRITYAGVGETYCQVSSVCSELQIWDENNNVCKSCTYVSNAYTDQFEHGCMPKCKAGFFVVPRQDASVTSVFTCQQCENSLAVFKSEQCAETSYLNDTCTEQNKNTPCMPCSGVQQVYQVLDAIQVSPIAYTRGERCKFRCRDSQYVGNSLWYYLDIDTAAEMMGMNLRQLQQKLAAHVSDADKVSITRHVIA